MKKQISVLLAVFASFYFISCQKEAITPFEESRNSAAVSANANNESKMSEAGVPFKGSYTTSSVLMQPPPNLVHKVSGTGIASHLGKSTFEAISNVTVSFPPPFTVSGTRTITAANGDQLFTTFTGTSTPRVNGMNGADLQETIIGGTGRFANASGSFTTKARNNFITSSFRADFDGYIKY
ncbi:MAG: hypothetical protein ACR2KB_09940 [Chitinophagaceae bacterium]